MEYLSNKHDNVESEGQLETIKNWIQQVGNEKFTSKHLNSFISLIGKLGR